jgi:hypothetical protein
MSGARIVLAILAMVALLTIADGAVVLAAGPNTA